MAEDSRSSTAANPWMRAVMPSVTDIVFVSLLGVLVFTPLSVRLLGDAGIGWHIRTGQQIVATHAVPRVDPFSSTMAGKPWFAWEWLYDVLVGVLESWFGLNGVVWFTAVVIAAVFAWLFRFLLARAVNLVVAVLLTLLAVASSMIHFLARPHVVSWLFTLAWFVILESSESDEFSGSRPAGRLWILPALMLVWVNVHGGFLIGFVLLAIFFVGAMWTWLRTKEDRLEDTLIRIAAGKRARSLIWVGLASAAASLINPYGWKLHTHVYSYLSNRFLMDHIDEFRSPDFHGIAPRCFLLLVVLALAMFATRGRELRASGVLTVLFAVYSGIYAARNIPVSAILLVMVLGPLLPPVSHGFFRRMTALESSMSGYVWAVLAVIVTFLVAANGGKIGSKVLEDAHFDPARMPVEAVNYLRAHGMHGPVLSMDSWGGYLIYRLYPDEKVVLDDRHDLYGSEFFKSYLNLVRGERDWEEFLQENPAGCVLLPRDSAAANQMIASGREKVIYSDDRAVLFLPAARGINP